MMIRAHMRGVAEIDLGVFPARKSFDPRVFLLEPLLHQRLVAFQGMIQPLLTADPELRQKPSNGDYCRRSEILNMSLISLPPPASCKLELQMDL
jgi:hypothetical protein